MKTEIQTLTFAQAFGAIRCFLANQDEPIPTFVTYDPDMKDGDFKVVRSISHDGTLYFIADRLKDVLLTVLHKTCAKKGQEVSEGCDDIEYVVGPITIETEYGPQNLPCGRFPGQRDVITMPVRARYIKATI